MMLLSCSTMNKGIMKTAACALAWLMGLGACGGFGAGDYAVYRVALSKTDFSAGCFTGGEVPDNEKDDTSTVGSSATMVLYGGADDAFYLDTGQTTFRGSATAGGYAFVSESVDVQVSGSADSMNAAREESRSKVNIDLTVDETGLSGTISEVIEYSCKGDGCPEVKTRTCTKKTTIVGTEVTDAALEHAI